MQFYIVSIDFVCGTNLLYIRVNKQTDGNAPFMKNADHGLDAVPVFDDVQATLRCQFLSAFRD